MTRIECVDQSLSEGDDFLILKTAEAACCRRVATIESVMKRGFFFVFEKKTPIGTPWGIVMYICSNEYVDIGINHMI